MKVVYHCINSDVAQKLISKLLSMAYDFKCNHVYDGSDLINIGICVYVENDEVHQYLLESIPQGWHTIK